MGKLFRQNRTLLALCFLLLLPCLSACGSKEEEAPSTVLVSVAEGEHYTVENNGQEVVRGEEVTFSLLLDSGYQLLETDFKGTGRIWQEENHALITLENVRYPERVHPKVSNTVFCITYNSNDGKNEEITVFEERKYHARPNTENAEVPFTREGYTLIGWSTEPNGRGQRVGLGSRVTVEGDGVTLYAIWVPWTDEKSFAYREEGDEIVITSCSSNANLIVIPEFIQGKPVTVIAKDAFRKLPAKTVVFQKYIKRIEEDAFTEMAMDSIVLYDSIEWVTEAAFHNCDNLKTAYINAAEKPAGAGDKKESVYADKVDLLIMAKGSQKMVFYGGCSMWYNLDMEQVKNAYGDSYIPIDLAINGTVNSEVQLQILYQFLEPGDVFFHTPELSSTYQLMESTDMGKYDTKLWAGLEYNYDLFAMVDLREVNGWASSFTWYLDHKKKETEYQDVYRDAKNRTYMGANGEVPFERYTPEGVELSDEVTLVEEVCSTAASKRLTTWYDKIAARNVKVFVSYACLNVDAITAEEFALLDQIDENFKKIVEATGSAKMISTVWDYCFYKSEFYDTNYHLLTPYAYNNTEKWLRDLKVYL